MAAALNIFVSILTMVGLFACAARTPPVADLAEARRLYETGDYPAAVREYEALVRALPQDEELWFRLGNGYVRLGEPEAAVDAYRNALLRKPGMGKAWHNLAEVHLQMALQAYLEGGRFIAADDPSLPTIKEKQQRLLELLEGDRAPEE